MAVGDARRLADVVLGRPAVGDGAVGAVPRADVAEDHEGGGAVLPALADVRAVRLLADRVEVELAHQLLEPQVVRPAWGANLQPRRLSVGEEFGAVAANDLIQRFGQGRGRLGALGLARARGTGWAGII